MRFTFKYLRDGDIQLLSKPRQHQCSEQLGLTFINEMRAKTTATDMNPTATLVRQQMSMPRTCGLDDDEIM